jgi:alpha-tubulin suppressor-like RCC1 family protein
VLGLGLRLGLGLGFHVHTSFLVSRHPYLFSVFFCGCEKQVIVEGEGAGVYSWGKCHFGQLGLGHMWMDCYAPMPVPFPGARTRVASIAAGMSHCLAATNAGLLYTWGCGFFGCLGLGDESHQAAPTLVPGFGPEQSFGVATKMAGGAAHSLVVVNGGTVFAFGKNNDGQLGLGDREDRKVPTKVGGLPQMWKVFCGRSGNHSAGISRETTIDTGDLYVWGSNDNAQLGVTETSISSPTLISFAAHHIPHRFAAGPLVKDVSLGKRHMATILQKDGLTAVYVCGSGGVVDAIKGYGQVILSCCDKHCTYCSYSRDSFFLLDIPNSFAERFSLMPSLTTRNSFRSSQCRLESQDHLRIQKTIFVMLRVVKATWYLSFFLSFVPVSFFLSFLLVSFLLVSFFLSFVPVSFLLSFFLSS